MKGATSRVHEQTVLGPRGLVAFLALLSAFVPLSTDLYLPALPLMTQYFGVAEYQTNLTLILFFVFYALATLIWGPLSDRYGRRPILLLGLTGYTLASALCALAVDINQLIACRVLQAVGAGAASAVATAIVKDSFQGRRRESILALVQSMVVISPAVAPVIGALLLSLSSWRAGFAAQAVVGMVVVALSIAYEETLEKRGTGDVMRTLGRLAVVLRNPAFTSLLIIFSMVSITTMAFISSSSYIYQDTFALGSQVYSFYFAFNAAGLLAGPLLYMRLATRFSRSAIVSTGFGIMALSGLLVVALGGRAPWAFALTLLPATIVASCVRPPGTFLMLEQQQDDAGSASALMSACQMVMGSVGMVIISFDWGSRVRAVGMVDIVFGLLCGGLWLVAGRRQSLGQTEGG